MTKKQYIDAQNGKGEPSQWGADVSKDYLANHDIPTGWIWNRPALADYYYYWFPLVKNSL